MFEDVSLDEIRRLREERAAALAEEEELMLQVCGSSRLRELHWAGPFCAEIMAAMCVLHMHDREN